MFTSPLISSPEFLQCGHLKKVTPVLNNPQENVLKHPRPFKICQHGASQKECKWRQRGGGGEGEGGGGGQEQEAAGQQPAGGAAAGAAAEEERPCNTVEDLKYRLVRFLIDSVDVQVVEKASVLRLQSGPLRLATCNLHGLQTKQGVTALVKEVRLRNRQIYSPSISVPFSILLHSIGFFSFLGAAEAVHHLQLPPQPLRHR